MLNDITGGSFVLDLLCNWSMAVTFVEHAWIGTYTSPHICYRTTLQKVNVQLNSFTFTLVRITRLMSCEICFMSFYFLFAYSSMHSRCIHWPLACTTQSCSDVMRVGILNICGKLFCVDKQRSNVPRENVL